MDLFGFSDDRPALDDEIDDNDIVIDLDTLEPISGKRYKLLFRK